MSDKIHETKNYSKFSLITYNRNINENHVEKIKNSMKTHGNQMPIFVDPNFLIMDGQHRFTALKRLGWPIKYIIIDIQGADICDFLIDVNTISEKWKPLDYLNMYCQLGNQNYIIPIDIDLQMHNNVLIWCEDFSVLFGSANLM